MSFDLDGYVDVAARLQILKDLHPEASLQPADLLKPYTIETIKEKTYIVVVAACYRDPMDIRPGIGMAWQELPGKGFTTGSELMVAETSAWGRAIVAAIQTSTKKIASTQEVKAAKVRQNDTRETLTAEGYTPYQIGRIAANREANAVDAEPQCKHGAMQLRKGTSEKTQKDYYGFVCISTDKSDQCPPDWWELAPNGQWRKKVAK